MDMRSFATTGWLLDNPAIAELVSALKLRIDIRTEDYSEEGGLMSLVTGEQADQVSETRIIFLRPRNWWGYGGRAACVTIKLIDSPGEAELIETFRLEVFGRRVGWFSRERLFDEQCKSKEEIVSGLAARRKTMMQG